MLRSPLAEASCTTGRRDIEVDETGPSGLTPSLSISLSLNAVRFGFVLLLLQLILKHGFRFNFSTRALAKGWGRQIIRYGAYAMLLAGSFAFYNNASYDQVTTFLGPEALGVFQTCFFIGVIVEMPRRNMAKVVGPIISTSIAQNDQTELKSIYQRSSITMSVLGMLLLIGIISNLPDLFRFIPKGEEFCRGYWVVIFICLAKLFFMLSSFSAEIISYSAHYRYNLFFQATGAVLLVLFNHLLIPIWGINGAAVAFLSATLIYLSLGVAFVKQQYNMYPITWSHFKLLGISVVVSAVAFLFQLDGHPVLVIFLRSVLTTVIFVPLVYYFKVSADFNRLGDLALQRLIGKK